jgi:hypothetical protein
VPAQEKLDSNSEMLVLTSYANTKNIILVAAETRGPLDEPAFGSAVQQLMTSFPHLKTTVRQVREDRRFTLTREYRPDMQFPFVVSDLNPGDSSDTVLDSILKHLGPRMDRSWDLFREAPGEVHIVRLGPDRQVIAFVYHHVAADGGMASEIFGALLGHYHAITRGEQAEWLADSLAMSAYRKRPVRLKKEKIRAALSDFVSDLPFTHRPTRPAGTGKRHDTREHHVKRVLSSDDTEKIVIHESQKGFPFIDRLIASTNLSLDEWNEAHDVPSKLVTTAVTVNTKGRLPERNEANNTAVIFFRSNREDRKDRLKFARSLAIARINQFRRQKDLQFYTKLSRLIRGVSVLPFRIRQRLVHFMLESQRYSVGVSFLGILWPAMKEGRPGIESCLEYPGDLEITEVHGLNYKPAGTPYINLIVYVYRSRLNLCMAESAAVLTREECDGLIDMIVRNLSEGFQ